MPTETVIILSSIVSAFFLFGVVLAGGLSDQPPNPKGAAAFRGEHEGPGIIPDHRRLL